MACPSPISPYSRYLGGVHTDTRWYPPRRRRGRWLVLAAAAVMAVAVTLVAVRSAPSATPSPAGAPEYYVTAPAYESLETIAAQDAFVLDTFTGKKVATVPAPHGWGFASVAAAGNDRTFVLGAERPLLGEDVPTRWYLLSLTPGAAPPVTLRQLPISPQPGAINGTIALSPAGTMLAFATGPGSPQPELQVYSTATGALLHTWSVTSRQSQGFQVSLLSWTSEGNQLAFQTPASAGPGAVAVRLLPAGDPGHDLLSDSRPVLSVPRTSSCSDSGYQGTLGVPETLLVAGNGQTVVCGGSKACLAGSHLYNMPILQYSTATGKLAGTLYQISSTTCQIRGTVPEVFWVNDAGTAVIGYFNYSEGINPATGSGAKTVVRFGLFTAGRFTPLPGAFQGVFTPLPNAFQGIAAW